MSSSRDKILATVKGNQPEQRALPELPVASGAAAPGAAGTDHSGAFIALLESIGGSAYLVSGYERIATILREQYPRVGRIISGCPELAVIAETGASIKDVSHDRNFAPGDVALVAAQCILETRDFAHIGEIHAALHAAGINFSA